MRRISLSKELLLFVFLIFLSGILFFTDQKGWLDHVRSVAERPVLAVEEKIYTLNISISRYLNVFSSRQNLDHELVLLQGQLRQLAFDQNKLNLSLEENEKMRRLLGAPLSPKWKFLPAKVVGSAEKLRINKGSADGLKQGMMVISENVLVGKIISLEDKSALVEIPINFSAKIPVVIKKPISTGMEVIQAGLGVQAKGLLIAQANQKLLVDQILQQEDVRIGDLVLTSGEASWLPDLLVGQVREVLAEGAAIYKKALVEPFVDYKKLSIVFVVIDY